jgi:hypothetical protein
MSELMSLYWSGAAEEKTSALQVNCYLKTTFFNFLQIIDILGQFDVTK